MANRVRALGSKIFNFAIARDILEANPFYRVPRPAQENQRDRVLTEDEIRKVWKALDSEPKHIAAAFRLLLLTAQRRSEVLGMKWEEVDLDSGFWTIPAERAKNRLAHRIPLAPQAAVILHGLQKKAKEVIPFVFPARRRNATIPLDNIQKPTLRTREASKVDDFKVHDLRRTAASHMASLGVQRIVISKILNHAEQGVTAVYERHGYDAEKAAALTLWDNRVKEIIEGKKAAKVVRMPRRA